MIVPVEFVDFLMFLNDVRDGFLIFHLFVHKLREIKKIQLLRNAASCGQKRCRSSETELHYFVSSDFELKILMYQIVFI